MSRRDAVWLAEAVAERRSGLKGPRAAALLAEAGLAVPAQPNSWAPLREGDDAGSWNVVGRLGHTEFFLEEQGDAPGIRALESRLGRGTDGAWPVLREDFAFVLGGARADDVLAQVCNVNFRALDFARRPVVMTLMIGVAVLVLPQVSAADGRIFRVWCDPTFGSYLWAELDDIVTRTTTGSAQ